MADTGLCVRDYTYRDLKLEAGDETYTMSAAGSSSVVLPSFDNTLGPILLGAFASFLYVSGRQFTIPLLIFHTSACTASPASRPSSTPSATARPIRAGSSLSFSHSSHSTPSTSSSPRTSRTTTSSRTSQTRRPSAG